MKKKELVHTLSERLRKAIGEDFDLIYDDACYNTFDFHTALEILRNCGAVALPKTNAILEKLKENETK